MFDSEKIVVCTVIIVGRYWNYWFYSVWYLCNYLDSNYKNASVESDQDRIKVINETDDEIDSASEIHSKEYEYYKNSVSCGSISEGEQPKVSTNTNINVARIKWDYESYINKN
jgi:hypothetical protein